jgi:hypothetical protein
MVSTPKWACDQPDSNRPSQIHRLRCCRYTMATMSIGMRMRSTRSEPNRLLELDALQVLDKALGHLAISTRSCLGWIRTTTSLTQNQEAYRLADQAQRDSARNVSDLRRARFQTAP